MPAIYKNGLLYAGTSGGSGANTDIIADEYTEKAYAVGDYCIHEDALYKCNTAITVAESWTAAHWTEKDIATELKAINSTIGTLGTAATKNVPVTGNASATEVVMGNDSRLTAVNGKMDKVDPYGSGSFSLNRRTGVDIGTNSFVEGSNCAATQLDAHAEGGDTTANGQQSHAEGSFTTAGGNYSHAEGYYTTIDSSATAAHAEGYYTAANGYYSHAEGENTIARCRTQHVFGRYNIPENGTYWERGTYVEIVGNGTSSGMPSNARTLDWDGNETLAGKLTLGVGPANNMDAATKQYVDTAISSAITDVLAASY